MEPAPTLVDASGGKYALADPSRTKILYFLVGVNDTWDSGNGGSIVVRLSNLSDSYSTAWFDPRTGNETPLGELIGGQDYVISPPSTDDWVLLLSSPTVPPNAPTGLMVE